MERITSEASRKGLALMIPLLNSSLSMRRWTARRLNPSDGYHIVVKSAEYCGVRQGTKYSRKGRENERIHLPPSTSLWPRGVNLVITATAATTEATKPATTRGQLLKASGMYDVWEALRGLVERGVAVAVATMGERGAAVLHGGRRITVPAYRVPRVVDATGAGDAFLGAFLSEYAKGEDVEWCGAVASAAASFVAEGRGPSRFGSKREVLERALGIYEEVRTV